VSFAKKSETDLKNHKINPPKPEECVCASKNFKIKRGKKDTYSNGGRIETTREPRSKPQKNKKRRIKHRVFETQMGEKEDSPRVVKREGHGYIIESRTEDRPVGRGTEDVDL